MLRRFGPRQAELSQPVAATLAPEAGGLDVAPELDSPGGPRPDAFAMRPRRRWFSWKRTLLGSLLLFVLMAGAVYSQKDSLAPRAADLSRKLIGDERTARVEGWFFKAEDRVHKVKYRFLGG
jgi:hypothetical protein